MPQKLATPVMVDSPVGPVEATHKIHNFAYNESGVAMINSSVGYGREVEGSFRYLKDISNVTITGDDLAALGTDITPATILAKHEEMVERNKAGQKEQIAQRRAQLEAELARLNTEG